MSRIVLLVSLAAGIAIFLATSARLPTTVATHFGAGGGANGFMTRVGYQVFNCASMMVLMITLLIAIHLLVVEAHTRTPPTLHEPTMVAVLGAFGALLVALLVAFCMRFRTRD